MSTQAIALFASFLSLEVFLRIAAWRVDPRKIYGAFAIRRYSLLPALGAVCVAAVSLVDSSVLIGHSTPARMAAGSLLCLFALVIRYPLAMTGLLARRFKLIRLRWEYVGWIWQALPMRHPRYLGLIAEAAGLAGILGSGLGVATVGFILIPAILLSVRLEERRVLADYPDSGLEHAQRESPPLRPPLSVAAFLLLAPGFPYLAIAFSTRELVLFNSDVETARVLLLSMAGAQGTWAILALSLTLVLMQIVASSYSTNLAGMSTLRWPVIGALAISGTSILYDVIIVARVDDWVGVHRARGEALVDVAFLLAAVSLCAIVLTSLESVRHVGPERLMGRLLRRLDNEWLQRIVGRWPVSRGVTQLDVNDPMRPIESVLRSLTVKADIGSLRVNLSQLWRRLAEIMDPYDHEHPEYWVALDACVHHYLRLLIRDTARQHDEDMLAEWLRLARLLAERAIVDRPYLIRNGASSVSELTVGDALLREISSSALEHGRALTARDALWPIEGKARALLSILPPENESYLFSEDFEALRQLTDDEQQRRYDNDEIVMFLEHRYIDYLGAAGETAAKARMASVSWSASYALSIFISQLCKEVPQSPVIRRQVVSWTLFRLGEVARVCCDCGARDSVHYGGLGWSLEPLDPSNLEDNALMLKIAGTVAAILSQLAEHGILDTTAVTDAAMLAVSAGKRLSDVAATILDALGQSLQSFPRSPGFDPSPGSEHSRVVRELRQRIEQIGWSVSGEGADAISKRAREILERSPE